MLNAHIENFNQGGTSETLGPILDRYLRADLTLEDARQQFTAVNIKIRELTQSVQETVTKLTSDESKGKFDR